MSDLNKRISFDEIKTELGSPREASYLTNDDITYTFIPFKTEQRIYEFLEKEGVKMYNPKDNFYDFWDSRRNKIVVSGRKESESSNSNSDNNSIENTQLKLCSNLYMRRKGSCEETQNKNN